MASMVDHLNKLREERIAREKARIEKLRELNLKKYSSNDFQLPKSSSSVSITAKPRSEVAAVAPTTSKSDTQTIIKNNNSTTKNIFKRPTTALKIHPNKDGGKNISTNNANLTTSKLPEKSKVVISVKTVSNKVCGDVKNRDDNNTKQVSVGKVTIQNTKIPNKVKTNVMNTVNDKKLNNQVENKESEDLKNAKEKGPNEKSIPKVLVTGQANDPDLNTEAETVDDKPLTQIYSETDIQVKKSNLKTAIPVQKLNGAKPLNGYQVINKNNFNSRKSIAVLPKFDNKPKTFNRRKTMLPEPREKSSNTNSTNSKESVFDRLYKPKIVHKQPIDNVTKLKTDPNYLKKVIKDSQLITNRRQTFFEQKAEVRRSISAIHFKRVHKSEISNCIHKWASIGDNINKEDLQNVNEDESLKEEKVISAVKSERKRVKFRTPLPYNFNTPRPEELRSKLQNWCKKKGKSIDSYHHLQCFGLHHLSNGVKPLDVLQFDDADDNKENIALEHDSDNESFLENNNQNGNLGGEDKSQFSADKWRRASNTTDTSDFNESYISTLTSSEAVHHVDELLLGALNDLTELLREGFDWEQCARWLRAVRERFPGAPDSAPYWECRAALEERRGDLHATVQCLEEAIAKGTEQSVVEANLDSLLNKFMQLKISPSSGRSRVEVDPKLVDVKNVFKSTIIRFAVQQAKLRQSNGTPKYTVTPVRRSHRLSRTHTPVRICSTIHQAKELGAEFRPNKALIDSP
ncbi:jg12035 [Pararge aegeria aegeria]|uniref:Jg12035 protein n=2 Tax=Pararge aegeria TaxID=116150 RepID=A0A8S4RVW5_9NEOP|nr:jg12035 [Pararge aegeria aegeria]